MNFTTLETIDTYMFSFSVTLFQVDLVLLLFIKKKECVLIYIRIKETIFFSQDLQPCQR